jgi:hypothetical protein
MNLTPIVCSACGHRGLLGLLAGLGQVAAFGV